MQFNPKDYTWIAFKKSEQKMVKIVNSYDPDDNEQEWYDFQKFAAQHTYATSDNVPEGVGLPGEMFGELVWQVKGTNQRLWVKITQEYELNYYRGLLFETRQFLPFIGKAEQPTEVCKKTIDFNEYILLSDDEKSKYYEFYHGIYKLKSNASQQPTDKTEHSETVEEAAEKSPSMLRENYYDGGERRAYLYGAQFGAKWALSKTAEAANKAFDKEIDEAMAVQREIDQAKIEALELENKQLKYQIDNEVENRLSFENMYHELKEKYQWKPIDNVTFDLYKHYFIGSNEEQFTCEALYVGNGCFVDINNSPVLPTHYFELPQPPKTEKYNKG